MNHSQSANYCTVLLPLAKESSHWANIYTLQLSPILSYAPCPSATIKNCTWCTKWPKFMIRSLPNLHTTILDLHSDLESPSGVFISAKSDCVGSLSTSCSTEWPLCPSNLSAESWHHDSLIRQTCKAWCKIMKCATTLGMTICRDLKYRLSEAECILLQSSTTFQKCSTG